MASYADQLKQKLFPESESDALAVRETIGALFTTSRNEIIVLRMANGYEWIDKSLTSRPRCPSTLISNRINELTLPFIEKTLIANGFKVEKHGMGILVKLF